MEELELQILKTRWFSRYARQERISDGSLREAMTRAERGLIDADLGSGIIKQRVARKGQGRSGGYRVIVAYRSTNRAVFLFGFSKSERENIEPDEWMTLRELASSWLSASQSKIDKAIADKDLLEIPHDEEA